MQWFLALEPGNLESDSFNAIMGGFVLFCVEFEKLGEKIV